MDPEQLFAATQQDFAPIYTRVAGAPAIPAGAVQESDRVLHRGSREGWPEGADVRGAAIDYPEIHSTAASSQFIHFK